MKKSLKYYKKKNIGRLEKVIKIENYSGISYYNRLQAIIPSLRLNKYKIIDKNIGGDAPKDFIKINSHRYIAKVGHKWYPIESITEYLMNSIGEDFGINIAKSGLRFAHGQIRFLSQYFLNNQSVLVHGAELYSAYLEEDTTDFVDNIEKERKSSEWFTFQVSIEAIKYKFPNCYDGICVEFVKMLLFDAIIGNNDRHFYNWGIIENIYGHKDPEFSPIYDTARGLFWNFSEVKVYKYFEKGKINEAKLLTYIKESSPKVGWNGTNTMNHFELIKNIFIHYPNYHYLCTILLKEEVLLSISNMFENKFKKLLSNNRFILIQECLNLRFKELRNICNLNT